VLVVFSGVAVELLTLVRAETSRDALQLGDYGVCWSSGPSRALAHAVSPALGRSSTTQPGKGEERRTACVIRGTHLEREVDHLALRFAEGERAEGALKFFSGSLPAEI